MCSPACVSFSLPFGAEKKYIVGGTIIKEQISCQPNQFLVYCSTLKAILAERDGFWSYSDVVVQFIKNAIKKMFFEILFCVTRWP